MSVLFAAVSVVVGLVIIAAALYYEATHQVNACSCRHFCGPGRNDWDSGYDS